MLLRKNNFVVLIDHDHWVTPAYSIEKVVYLLFPNCRYSFNRKWC